MFERAVLKEGRMRVHVLHKVGQLFLRTRREMREGTHGGARNSLFQSFEDPGLVEAIFHRAGVGGDKVWWPC